jgi:hypothetical protein
MAKYRLLTKDGYPEYYYVKGGCYDEDLSFSKGGCTISELACSFPNDWELISDVDDIKDLEKRAKELGYILVKEEPSNEWVVAGNKYLYQDSYLRILDDEDGESVYIQEEDLDEVIQKIQSIRNS